MRYTWVWEHPIAWVGALTITGLAVISIIWPPYTAIAVTGAVLGAWLLIARPDIAFALFFAAETLISEDILLVTEKLKITLYRVPLPYLGLNAFELALILLLAITILQRKGRLHGTKLDFSLFLYALACLIGYITCIVLYHEPTRLFEPRRLMHFFIAYFLAVNLLRTKASLRMFLLIYLSAIALKSMEGVYLYTMGSGLQIKWKIRAIFTGWGDSLNFVTYLLIVSTFLLDRLPFPGKRFFILASPAVFFSFLFSYKRAYYVAFVMGLGMLFLLQGRKARFRFLGIGLAALIVMMGIIIAAGQWDAIGMRLDSILHPTKESSANYRLVEWANALISIKNDPVFGIGLGGVMPMEIFLARTNLLGVHNTYLWVAVKLGAIGLFAYLFLHFCFFQQLLKQNTILRDPFLRTLSRAVTCAFIAFCAAEMFAPMFAQMRTATWFGIMLAIGMMLPNYDTHENNQFVNHV